MRYEINLITGAVTGHPDAGQSSIETQAQTIARYEAALDAHLDAVARQHRYDNRFTFALRAGFAGPYQAEGAAFALWMDTCNYQAFQLLESVLAGESSIPSSAEEFIAMLPVFEFQNDFR